MNIKGYRTVSTDRKSYNNFQWGGVGSINIAHDWNSNKDIQCGNGLHFNTNEADQSMATRKLLEDGRIFQIIEAADWVKVSKKYRCRQAKVLREITINSQNYCEIFLYLGGEWLCWAGYNWKGVTDEMRREAWERLREKELYEAGCDWEGVTDEMRREAWEKLEGEWLYWAGRYWKRVTKRMKKEALGRLRKEWLYWAGCDWKGITNDMRKEAWERYDKQKKEEQNNE